MESIPPDYCRGGFNKLADPRFEKPITFTSSDIFKVILLQTLYVASTSFSTEANIPSGGFAEPSLVFNQLNSRSDYCWKPSCYNRHGSDKSKHGIRLNGLFLRSRKWLTKRNYLRFRAQSLRWLNFFCLVNCWRKDLVGN